MDNIQPMLVIVSMILGLGVTRVLTGLVAVFRSRLRARLDWVPIVWALSLFFTQIQFWWGINDEPMQITYWRFETFFAFITLPILLFIAAALLLPASEMPAGASLRRHFEDEGRFALLALAVYELAALAANLFLFGDGLLTVAGGATLILGLLQLIAFFAPRRVQVAATLLQVPVIVIGTILVSDI